MGTTEFDGVKGFLPQEEALQLLEWASQGALIGPLLEIGSYCGLSTLWLAKAARAAKTVVFAVDHHRGSEEHQAGEFFQDENIAVTVVDRIIHHSHIFMLGGESYRLKHNLND